MIKQAITIISISLVAASCGSDVKSEQVTVQAIAADTIKEEVVEAIQPNSELEAVLKLFTAATEFPFELNAETIDKIEGSKGLKGKDVKMLSGLINGNALFSEIGYGLREFYMIDSIKAKGHYKEWAEQRDLGETKQSDIYPLYKIQTGDASYVLIWMLDYSTVEACPYSYAKTVFATSVHKNKIGETTVFAEHSGGGDAPVSFDRRINGNISKDLKLVLNLREESDQDEPKVEITEGTYELDLKEGLFIFTKEDKKKPKMVKRKV